MKKVSTPEQFLQALRQVEGGTVVGEICRKLALPVGALMSSPRTPTACRAPMIRRENLSLEQPRA